MLPLLVYVLVAQNAPGAFDSSCVRCALRLCTDAVADRVADAEWVSGCVAITNAVVNCIANADPHSVTLTIIDINSNAVTISSFYKHTIVYCDSFARNRVLGHFLRDLLP